MSALDRRRWMQRGQIGRPSRFLPRSETAGKPAGEDGNPKTTWTRIVVAAQHRAGGIHVGEGNRAIFVEWVQTLVGHHAESHLLGGIEVLEVMHARAGARRGKSVLEDAQSQQRLRRDARRAEPAADVTSSREHEGVGAKGSGRGAR